MIKKISSLHQNIYIYFCITTFNNFWFITSSWVNYWLKYMSISEVGVIDAIAFSIGILIEIPSGLISDRLGRKYSLILASFFQFLGSFLITISFNKFEIAAGFIIFQIGTALFSGTIEAFGYEEASKNNLDYQNLLLKSQYFASFGNLFSLVVGGYFYLLNKNIPNFLWSMNYLISLLFSILITIDSQPSLFDDLSNSASLKIRDYLHNFNFKTTFYLIILSSIVFSFDYGFLKLTIMENFSTIENNYYFLFIAISLALIVNHFLIEKTKNYEKIIFFIYIILTFLLITNTFYKYSLITLFFFLTFLTIYIYQVSLNYINTRIRDSVRASFISMFNFAYKIPYVFIALFLGFSLESTDISLTLTYLGVFMVVVGLLSNILLKLVYNKTLEMGA